MSEQVLAVEHEPWCAGYDDSGRCRCRAPQLCSCGQWCRYDGWDHVHKNGLGLDEPTAHTANVTTEKQPFDVVLDVPPALTADDLRGLPLDTRVESRHGNLLRRFPSGWVTLSEGGLWDMWAFYSDAEVAKEFGPHHICAYRGRYWLPGAKCHLHAPAEVAQEPSARGGSQ